MINIKNYQLLDYDYMTSNYSRWFWFISPTWKLSWV